MPSACPACCLRVKAVLSCCGGVLWRVPCRNAAYEMLSGPWLCPSVKHLCSLWTSCKSPHPHSTQILLFKSSISSWHVFTSVIVANLEEVGFLAEVDVIYLWLVHSLLAWLFLLQFTNWANYSLFLFVFLLLSLQYLSFPPLLLRDRFLTPDPLSERVSSLPTWLSRQ